MASVRRDSRTRTTHKIPTHGPRAGRRLATGLALRVGGPDRRGVRVHFRIHGLDQPVVRRRAGPAVPCSTGRSAHNADRDRPAVEGRPRRVSVAQLVPRQGDQLPGEPPPEGADSVRGVELRPKKSCPENEGDEPAFIEALRIAEAINVPLVTNKAGTETTFGPHHIPLAGNQMLINFTKGASPTCAYVDALNASCLHPESITGHIVVVGTKLIDAGDVYSQAVNFPHDLTFCPTSRQSCMLDNQNYGYRILGDAMSTILSDRYIRIQPPISLYLAILLLSTIVGLVVYLPSFRNGMLITAGILLAYFAVIVGLGQNGYLADPLFAPIAVALAAIFSLGARYVLEERERRKVELIFGHWVDPRIARQLAASKSIDEIISRGERRDLTMLFVDIRGFTAMSEAMRAEDVLAVIQDYLEELTALIFKWDTSAMRSWRSGMHPFRSRATLCW